MSWEETCKVSSVCPCGQGIIEQSSYMDDWNRYKDGSPIFKCEYCSTKYYLESAGFGLCYLTPILYPKYIRPKGMLKYGKYHNMSDDFVIWLIENFDYCELVSALDQIKLVTNASKLTGIASRIRNNYKYTKGTVKIKFITEVVELAVNGYYKYVANKECRDKARQLDLELHNAYIQEKRKHQIKIIMK